MPEFKDVAALFSPKSWDALGKLAVEQGRTIEEVAQEALDKGLKRMTQLPKPKGKVVAFGRGPAQGLKSPRD